MAAATGTILALVLWAAFLSSYGRMSARSLVEYGGFFSYVVGFGAIGFLLTVRRRDHPLGWLLLGFAFIFAVGLAADEYARTAADASAVATRIAGAASQSTFPIWAGLLVTAIVVFPHGRIPSLRWRNALVVAFSLLALTPLAAPFMAFEDETTGTVVLPLIEGAEWVEDVLWIVTLPVLVIATAGLVRLVVMARRGDPTERRQIRWVAFAIAVVLGSLVVELFVHGANVVAHLAGGLGVPIAMAIAITRYRLYDIDRIVSRTVTYVIVAVVLVAVLVAVAIGPALVLESGEAPSWAVAAGTLFVFALFDPLRRKVQRGVDRRFNRLRYDPATVTATLSTGVRDEIDPARITRTLAAAARDALEPRTAGVWIKAPVRAPIGNDLGTPSG